MLFKSLVIAIMFALFSLPSISVAGTWMNYDIQQVIVESNGGLILKGVNPDNTNSYVLTYVGSAPKESLAVALTAQNSSKRVVLDYEGNRQFDRIIITNTSSTH